LFKNVKTEHNKCRFGIEIASFYKCSATTGHICPSSIERVKHIPVVSQVEKIKTQHWPQTWCSCYQCTNPM